MPQLNAKTKKTLKKLGIEMGATGTSIWKGFINETDYNEYWSGHTFYETVEWMRKGDATTKTALRGLKLPIISAKWFMREADETDEAVKIKDFVEAQLFENKNFRWNGFLEQALNYLDYGHYVFEKVYEDVDWEGTELWGIAKLGARLPDTIERWKINKGEDDGIVQVTNQKRRVEIPRWKLIYLQNEMEGDNYKGESVLRSAFPHFYIKVNLYKIDAIASERQGAGIPRARRSGMEGGGTLKDEEKQMLEEIMENIRVNEAGYIIEPNGYEIEFMDTHATSNKSMDAMIQHHNRQILSSVFLQFLALGEQNSGGSYALSENHSDLLYLSLNSIAGYVRDVVQQELINELIEFNFGPEALQYAPTLEYEGIGDIDINTFSVGVQRLVQSKVLSPNIELEIFIRNILKLPPLTEDQIEEMRQREEEERQMARDRETALVESLRNRTQEATQVLQDSARKFRASLGEIINYLRGNEKT